jgi:TatD DNase family protein
MQYINLHTHRKPQVEGEWCIRNGYTGAGYTPDDLPYSISLGIHPWFIQENSINQLNAIQKRLHHKNVIAIGECGLDRFRGPALRLQESILEAHIELANAAQKPMILHLVRCYSDFLKFTKQINVPWVIHGFKGSIIEARKMLDRGGCLSFGHRLFMNDSLHETLRYVPNDRLYLETDVRALKIDVVYRHVASIKGIQLGLLQEALWSNARRDFKDSPLLPF